MKKKLVDSQFVKTCQAHVNYCEADLCDKVKRKMD